MLNQTIQYFLMKKRYTLVIMFVVLIHLIFRSLVDSSCQKQTKQKNGPLPQKYPKKEKQNTTERSKQNF